MRQPVDAPQRGPVTLPGLGGSVLGPNSCMFLPPGITVQGEAERVDGRPQQRLVRLSDGTRFRVTRFRWPVVTTRSEFRPPRGSVGSDADRIWVQIDWCRGTRGQIRLSGNVQEAARDLLRNIAQEIANGGDADAVLRAARATDVTPSLTFDIAQSGSWRISAGVNVVVNGTGVTGGGGRVEVERGPFGAGVEGSGSSGGWNVTVFGSWTPGRESERFQCPTRERLVVSQMTRFECVRERHIPPSTRRGTRPVPTPVERVYYVYFPYASHSIDQVRSAGELAGLARDLDAGFRISAVEGFASPEGPLGRRGRFIGNRPLAERRAEEAAREVRRMCSGCIDPGVEPVGREELYSLGIEGPAQEQHAVEQFGSQAAEERHRERAQLEGRTPGQQAAAAYEWLRRAEIRVHGTETQQREYTEPVPARTETEECLFCPAEVEEVVRRSF